MSEELSPDDPRMAVAVAIQTLRAVVDRVTADQLDRPTPCGDYDARTLMSHAIVAVRRLTMAGEGYEGDWGDVTDPSIADGDHAEALATAAHDLQNAWMDASLLEKVVTLPFAQLPGAMALNIFSAEYLTHAWDLAAATGQQVAWPAELAAEAAAGMKMGLPAEGRDMPGAPFGPVVDVADDAPAIERLVAWTGRNPADWPSTVA